MRSRPRELVDLAQLLRFERLHERRGLQQFHRLWRDGSFEAAAAFATGGAGGGLRVVGTDDDDFAHRADFGGEDTAEGAFQQRSARAPQTMELLQSAPFMKPLEAQELGKVYELAWYDFGRAASAIEAIGASLPARGGAAPITVWSVRVGSALDRVYVLTLPELDRDTSCKPTRAPGPGLPVAAISAGSKLLLADTSVRLK